VTKPTYTLDSERDALFFVISAAEIRRDQWRAAGKEGFDIYDTCAELFEADEQECANMDHLLTKAIDKCDKMAERMRRDGGNR
jgi:hypothetical protein